MPRKGNRPRRRLAKFNPYFKTIRNSGPPLQIFNQMNRSLRSERKTQLIRLTTGPGVVSASAGGVAAGFVLIDPSISSYTEEKSIQALYSSYRLKAARLILSPETGNTTKRSVYFASLLNTGIGNPTSYAQISDNANWMDYANIANDTTGRPKVIGLASNTLNFQEWGTTATDGSGGPGGFYWYGDGLTASLPVFIFNLEVIFEVRNRV